MLCQVCNKNDASLHYTKIVNGEIEELHLCETCSKGNHEFDFDKTFSFHKLLTEIIDGVQGSPREDREDLYCEKCGLNYLEFKQLGKLGCDQCYESFRDKLLPLIKNVQGNERHTGKIPRRAGKGLKRLKEVEGLRKDLDQAILEEEFEVAALIRDRIKVLEDAGEGDQDD